MSKELIEQLAKEHGYKKRLFGEITHRYEFLPHELEAFAKAYAQTQGQSNCHTITESIDGDVAMSQLVAGQLIAIREELAKGYTQEAYHLLYGIADPNYTSLEPWKRLEEIAMLNAAPIESGVKG
jgi:hypothetical protein